MHLDELESSMWPVMLPACRPCLNAGPSNAKFQNPPLPYLCLEMPTSMHIGDVMPDFEICQDSGRTFHLSI